MVRVVVVVIVVDGLAARMIRMVRVIPGIVGVVVWVIPAPTVTETVVIPIGGIVVGTVVVSRPPPVITQVNAQTPAGWIIIIPIHIGEVGIVIAPTGIYIGVEPTEAGTVTVVVIVIGVVTVAASGDRSVRIIDHFHIRSDDRLRAARIVGQCAEQVAVFVSLINDGIGFHGRGRGGSIRGDGGCLLHDFFARRRVYVIVIGKICCRTGC